MKSFKKHLTENIQDELSTGDSEELEYSPVPYEDPFPLWNPFANQYPPYGHSDLEFLGRPPYSLLSDSVVQRILKRLAWHIFTTTGRWPEWWEPSVRQDFEDADGLEILGSGLRDLRNRLRNR